MKKVYVLINHLQVQDGVARTAIGMVNELAKRPDVEVTIQSLFKFDKQMKSWFLPQVKVKPFLGFYFRGLPKLIDLIPDKLLYRLLVREAYDVEIGFCMALPIRIVAASTNRASRRYAWIHGYDTGLSLLDSYKKMDKVIAVSVRNKERFVAETGGMIPAACCHNLIEDEKVRAMGQEPVDIAPSSEITFVTVGRLDKGKGVARLVECCGKLKQEGYRFRLWLIGDGVLRKKLEARVVELNLSREVFFLGSQSNPHAYTAKADALICASYSEGYSTACVEAILLGVPVLTTDVGGAREIIQDAEAGLVVGMEDADLYAGMKRILDEPALLAQWRHTLLNTRDVFSYKNRAEELMQALDI